MAENVKKVIDTLENENNTDKYFGRDKRPVQRLGQGVHNDVFYYGVSTTEGYPAVVTSDNKVYIRRITWEKDDPNNDKEKPKKRIHDDIKTVFGLNYQHDFDDEAIEYAWKQTHVRKYLMGIYSPPKLKEMIEKMVSLNTMYISHLEAETHTYLACYTVASYCFSLFESMGRILYNAERGSGKSKQSRINKLTMFNTMWITKGTESSTVRNLEATCGTPIIDNYDKIHEDTKKAIDHLFETGLYPDAKYRLTDKDTMRTTAFRTYSPLIMNNIMGLDDNTIDKCVEIKMLRTKDKLRTEHPDTKNPIWEGIRDDCRLWVLDHWKEILKVYGTLEAGELDGRFFDVIKGTLTIAKMCSEGAYNDVMKFCKLREAESKIITIDGDWKYRLFMELKEKCKDMDQWVSMGQIADIIVYDLEPVKEWTDKEGMTHYDNSDLKRKTIKITKWAAKTMKRTAGFKRTRVLDGKTLFWINCKHLDKYIDLMGYNSVSTDTDSPEKEQTAHSSSLMSLKSLKSLDVTEKPVSTSEISEISEIKIHSEQKVEKWKNSPQNKDIIGAEYILKSFNISQDEIDKLKEVGRILEEQPGWYRLV